MKYLIIVPDGSADDPIDSLNGKTPLEAAALPYIDALAAEEVKSVLQDGAGRHQPRQ